MSAHAIPNLDSVTPDAFRTWRRALERKRRKQPDLVHSFSVLIEAGCDRDDLEWARFWVAFNFYLSRERSDEIKELKLFLFQRVRFFRKLATSGCT
jgi:hypothetical protein